MIPGISTLASSIGIKGGAIIALCIALAVCWFGWDRAALQRDVARAQVKELIAASEEAGRLAERQKAEIEARYRNLAERTDNATIERLEDELGNAERFIAANRVCPSDRGSPSRPAPAAGDNGPGNTDGPGEAPELDGVIVPADDVRICTINTTRLEAAREWALELTDRP